MVDFPNAPIEGDTHTEEGQTWTYIDGAWIVGLNSASLLEIVESGLPGANWQVWGDTLIQWGNDRSGVTNNVIVTFPVAFKSEPAATVSGHPQSDRNVTVTASTTQLTVARFNTSGGNAQTSFYWIAVGEAPDDLKKPKGIPYGAGGGGGGGASITIGDTFPASPDEGNLHYLTVQPVGLYLWYDDGTSQQWVQSNGAGAVPGGTEVFFDPTGAASWSLDRDTMKLEMWGLAVTGAGGFIDVNLPKSFAAVDEYRATATPTGGSIASDNVSAQMSQISGSRLDLWVQRGASGVAWGCNWHAIGKWDGVS